MMSVMITNLNAKLLNDKLWWKIKFRMLRAVNFVSTSVRLKRYDFIKSYNAVDVNYERIGFRKVNGKYIDASTVVNASTLSAIQQHYALARPPPPDDLRLFLSAGDLSDLRQLIGNNIDAFSNIDKHAFLIGVGQKFGQNALQLPEFSSTLVHALQSHQNAKELVELTDLSTRVLGFDYTSPVASRLLESVAYHINDISLLDTVKLSISLNPDSHVFGALTYRTQQLIDALLFNESGSNKELLKKFEGWSLIDFCLLTLTLQSRQSIEVIEDLLPYVLYEQVLQKHVSTGFGKTFFINIDCSLFFRIKNIFRNSNDPKTDRPFALYSNFIHGIIWRRKFLSEDSWWRLWTCRKLERSLRYYFKEKSEKYWICLCISSGRRHWLPLPLALRYDNNSPWNTIFRFLILQHSCFRVMSPRPYCQKFACMIQE